MIVAMFAFVFGGYIGRSGSDPRHDAVVVEWNFDNHGALHEMELQNAKALLTRFNQFLRSLMMEMGGHATPGAGRERARGRQQSAAVADGRAAGW